MTRDARAAALVLLGCAALGLVLGALWALLAPPVPAGVLTDGTVVVLDPQASDGFVPMGLFLAGSALAGLLVGGATWTWRSRRGPALLLAATVGGALCSGVAALVGTGLAHLRYSGAVEAAAPETLVDAAPGLTSWSVVLVQPLAVVLVQTVLVALARRDDLGRPDHRSAPVHPAQPGWSDPALGFSSGSAER